jgi:hypothetical protein
MSPPAAACVLLRVHERMADLEVGLEIIRKHWHRGPYHVLVVSNGLSRRIPVPDGARRLADQVLELDDNPGHMRGTSQLLQAGIAAVPAHCRWTVLLEADTWIFDDAVLRRCMEQMERQRRVWASAIWVEKFYSLALDAAIVETAFARDHPTLFEFREPPGPEAWVHEELQRAGQQPLYIREHMPVHVPAAMRRFHNPFGGRFRTFVGARMVTHHVEDLPGGLLEKKRIANHVLGRREFDVPWDDDLPRRQRRLRLEESLRRWVPRSTWFRKRRWRTLQVRPPAA